MTVRSRTARKLRKVVDAAAERRGYLMSEAFAAQVTTHFGHAASAAVARHHEAGLPVHGEKDGCIVEVTPRQRDEGEADT